MSSVFKLLMLMMLTVAGEASSSQADDDESLSDYIGVVADEVAH